MPPPESNVDLKKIPICTKIEGKDSKQPADLNPISSDARLFINTIVPTAAQITNILNEAIKKIEAMLKVHTASGATFTACVVGHFKNDNSATEALSVASVNIGNSNAYLIGTNRLSALSIAHLPFSSAEQEEANETKNPSEYLASLCNFLKLAALPKPPIPSGFNNKFIFIEKQPIENSRLFFVTPSGKIVPLIIHDYKRLIALANLDVFKMPYTEGNLNMDCYRFPKFIIEKISRCYNQDEFSCKINLADSFLLSNIRTLGYAFLKTRGVSAEAIYQMNALPPNSKLVLCPYGTTALSYEQIVQLSNAPLGVESNHTLLVTKDLDCLLKNNLLVLVIAKGGGLNGALCAKKAIEFFIQRVDSWLALHSNLSNTVKPESKKEVEKKPLFPRLGGKNTPKMAPPPTVAAAGAGGAIGFAQASANTPLLRKKPTPNTS